MAASRRPRSALRGLWTGRRRVCTAARPSLGGDGPGNEPQTALRRDVDGTKALTVLEDFAKFVEKAALGMVVHALNPSTQEEEAEISVRWRPAWSTYQAQDICLKRNVQTKICEKEVSMILLCKYNRPQNV